MSNDKRSFNDIIEIITPDNKVQKVKILSRSGKVGKKGYNKYAQSWNVLTPSGDIQSLDLKNDVSSWQFICKDTIPSSDQELLSNEVYQAEISTEIEEAKSRGLNGWKERAQWAKMGVSHKFAKVRQYFSTESSEIGFDCFYW